MGRQRKNPPKDGWKKKLHAVFFELAELNREFEKRWAQLKDGWRRELQAAGSAAGPAEIIRLQDKIAARVSKDGGQLDQWFEQQLIDINKRYTPMPYNPIAYSYFTLDPPITDSEGLREYLHFHRHGEALRVTESKDAQGDIKAWDKIARTERDFRILAFHKGPITPFQEDVVHRQLLQLVICFESERLTAEELVLCFDEYCACGKENHETDALRKMRDRFEAELRAR